MTILTARLAAIVLVAVAWTSYPAQATPTIAKVQKQVADARAMMMVDPASAAAAANLAARDAAQLPAGQEKRFALATTNWLQAEAALRSAEYEKANRLIATATSQGGLASPQLAGDILLTRGGLHNVRGEVGPALTDFQSAFANFKTADNDRSQAIALMLIASLYSGGKDYERALRYLTEATEVYQGDPGMMIALYNNRGGALQDLKRHGDAERQFQIALSYAERLRSPGLLVQVLCNIARNRLKGGQVGAAEQALRRALSISDRNQLDTWRPQLFALSAEAALQRRDLAQAAELIDRSFAGVDVSTTEPDWLEPHMTAYRIYARLGRYALAMRHLAAVKRIDDAATALATSTSNALMAARFDFANQELRIANLKSEELRRNVALAQARTRFQQIIFLSVAGATAIVILLLAIGLFTLRRSRNQLRVARDGLAETNIALTKALAAKTEFLATTSHEIRTPLNGILGMTQVMLADPALDHATRDRLDVVRGAGLTMRALVDDILDVAKMETGHLTLEDRPYDLHATVTDAGRLWEQQAQAKGLGFNLQCDRVPGMVVGDAARIRQIVFNLLSNAIKFTDRGHVSLAVRADVAGGSMTIAVADTGMGIPADKQEAIFESFQQADASTTRTHGGTGLGLAICRNLVLAMGGDIAVDSMVGSGARFTVTLPLRVAPEDAGTIVAQDIVPALLILDRSPITRSMWRTLLERRAGRLVFAATVAEALAALAGDRVRQVLIDDATLLADPDPIAAIDALAERARGVDAETVLLWTGNREGGDAIVASATRMIAKPIAGQALVAQLFNRDYDAPAASPLVSDAA